MLNVGTLKEVFNREEFKAMLGTLVLAKEEAQARRDLLTEKHKAVVIESTGGKYEELDSIAFDSELWGEVFKKINEENSKNGYEEQANREVCPILEAEHSVRKVYWSISDYLGKEVAPELADVYQSLDTAKAFESMINNLAEALAVKVKNG